MTAERSDLTKSDRFIAEALATGSYTVNLRTGTIVGPRGKQLARPMDRDGYVQTVLFLNGTKMTVRAHRLVAAAAWGIEAIVGREVAHRNGNPSDNRIDNLWLPASLAEHYRHDNAMKPKQLPPPPTKVQWDPCARCKDPDGRLPVGGGRTPARISGEPFGIDGSVCLRCYGTLYMRRRRADERHAALRPAGEVAA